MTWDTEGEWIRSPGKSMAGNQKCCSVGWDTQDSLTERFLRLLKPEAGEEGATPKYTWGQSRLCAWNWEQRQTWGPDRAGFYYEQSWVDFSKLQAKNGRHLTFRKGQASLWGANGGLAAKVEAGGTSSTASYPKDKGGSGLPSSSSAAAAKILRGGPSLCSVYPTLRTINMERATLSSTPAETEERNTLVIIHNGGGKIGETEMGLESIIFTRLMILSGDIRKVKMRGAGGWWNEDITGRENWRLERDKKNIHMENP